ncbi:TetR/AcrR family transcriptional regulator [Rhodococcus sp. 077-4]|uniref:TetR/AcrR family transcriptional regulator n=1 Tax=Rhodococcus sp. 077-4 TaxID=2789271 RepID=UPI0039F4CB44
MSEDGVTVRGRVRRAGGERRFTVLDHVISVIAERGYGTTRYADVSAVSGIAVSTLQGYFGSREDMLIEAFERATSIAVDGMNQLAAQHDDPLGLLVAMVDMGLDTDTPTWRMLGEFWTAAAHDPDLRQRAVELARRYREPFADAVRRGVERGAFEPKFEVAVIVESTVASIVGILHPMVLGHWAIDHRDYRKLILTQLAFALGTPIEDNLGDSTTIGL